MTIIIGRLRHRVSILQPNVTAQNGRGEPVQTSAPLSTTWAEIRPLSGRELFAAQQRAAQVTHAIVMRYPGFRVMPEMTLSFDGRTFDILDVLDIDERHVELQMLAKERL